MPGGIHAPIEEILKWPTPNYVNPVTRPNTIFLVACTCGPITFIMLMTRLWVRIFHQRNPGWDDWLIVAGTIPTIAATVLFPLAKESGFDRHIWDIDLIRKPELVVRSRKYVLALLCIFCVASGLIKISILLFYRRLSSRVVSNRFRWATWLTIGSIVAYTIALTIAPIFGCDPISAFWDQANFNKLIKGYKYRCFDEGADVFSASVISTVQDLITAILPTFLYWNLHIPIRQKIALFGIFALGYGVAALGAIRAYYSWQIYYNTYDVTWVTWDLFLVTMLELHVGCFCANAPTFKVFFKHFFNDKLISSVKRSHGTGQSGQKKSGLFGTQSSKASAGTFKEKMSVFFSKSTTSHSRSGYLSEPHEEISVDVHGGVQVQKEVHVAHSPALTIGTSQHARRDLRESTDTTDMICAHYYDDIELGRFTTGRNSQVSSLHSQGILEEAEPEPLPPLPQTPISPRLMRSILPPRHQVPQPRSSANTTWPDWPLPATIAEDRNEDPSRLHSQHSRSTGERKPQWQSWT